MIITRRCSSSKREISSPRCLIYKCNHKLIFPHPTSFHAGAIPTELFISRNLSISAPSVKPYILDLVRPFLDLVRPYPFVWLICTLLPHFFLAIHKMDLTIAVFACTLSPPVSQSLLSLLSLPSMLDYYINVGSV
uniref:Uncharacterized protein n=1 Tax=Arundo donax TaxID=35708 RepID=A0A0A9FXQ6_ARUDO